MHGRSVKLGETSWPFIGPVRVANLGTTCLCFTGYGPESVQEGGSPPPAGTPPPRAGPPPSAGESRGRGRSKKRSRSEADAIASAGATSADSDSSASAGHASVSADTSAGGDASTASLHPGLLVVLAPCLGCHCRRVVGVYCMELCAMMLSADLREMSCSSLFRSAMPACLI